MTVLINLLGSPSAGKSTAAGKLFSYLKDLNLNVEFVPEYVKSWAWDKRTISPYDQFYFFGKEAHNQSHLFNKVDFVISDSPVLLTAFYHLYYNNDHALREVCKDFYEMAEKIDNVQVVNFFLPRKKKYNSKGRYQTQEQADAIAEMLKNYLKIDCYPYIEVDCKDSERVDFMVKELKKITNDFEGLLDESITLDNTGT